MVNLKLFGGPDYPKHSPSLKVTVMLLPAQTREAGAWKLTQCDKSHQARQEKIPCYFNGAHHAHRKLPEQKLPQLPGFLPQPLADNAFAFPGSQFPHLDPGLWGLEFYGGLTEP